MDKPGEDEIHPLQNPVILEIISKHCNVKTLKTFRLVSKEWHRSCMKAWKSLASVSIVSHGYNSRTVCTFLDFFEGQEKPLRNGLLLHRFTVDKDVPRFWEIFGSNITTLNLQWVTLDSVDALRNVLFSSCPNMERLKLHKVSVTGAKHVKEPDELIKPKLGANLKLKSLTVSSVSKLGIAWMEILCYYPHLENLEVISKFYEAPDYGGLILSLTTARNQDSTRLKIKQLHVQRITIEGDRWRLSPSLINLLTNTNLALSALSISLCPPNEQKLKQILTFHVGTLKRLHVDCQNSHDYPNPLKSFPLPEDGELSNIQELRIDGFGFQNFTFLKVLPKLKKLTFCKNCCFMIDRTRDTDMESVKAYNCKALAIVKASEFVYAHHFKKLIDWFPNIEELEIPYMDNSRFALMCATWKNLTSLTANESEVDDIGITGLDAKEIRLINQTGMCKPTWIPNGIKPNIGCLKKLRRFAMYPAGHRNYDSLGYSSALCFALKLPNLQQLQVNEYHLKDKIWEQLQAKYPW